MKNTADGRHPGSLGQGAAQDAHAPAEVVQILGFPRSDGEVADEFFRAIGTAIFESRSGTVAGDAIAAATRRQTGS